MTLTKISNTILIKILYNFIIVIPVVFYVQHNKLVKHFNSVLIHGASAVLACIRQDSPLVSVKSLYGRQPTGDGMNKAAVALANKNARIVRRMLHGETVFMLPS